MSGTSSTDKTRPDQLLPSEVDAQKAIQGFLHVMGFNPGSVDGDFQENSLTAYDLARQEYGFLPELNKDSDQASFLNVLHAIDNGLQDDIIFQRMYITGIQAEENNTQLQAALVAGGSWANRHLGDRISEAEPITIDGDRGVLTDRGVRNAAYLTGMATLQSTLNLLTGSTITPSGILDEDTTAAMQTYADNNGIKLSGTPQENFTLITDHISENQGAEIQSRLAEILNKDTDFSVADPGTLDAQIVMNGLAREQGSDIRTAPDSLQTDSHITAENSHTRTVIAPETGVNLAPIAEPEVEIAAKAEGAPYGLNEMYRVTRNDVLNDVESITALQALNPDAPEHILAYSEESGGFLLVSARNDGTSTVFQISDRNVDNIMNGVNSGEIALDVSARKFIAEKVHGNTADTTAYSTDELREAFVDRPQKFTNDTRESLLTATITSPTGDKMTFGLDDLHDALDQMDSKYDWSSAPDPIAAREFIKDLRQASEDAREERVVNVPEWQGHALDETNSVDVMIGGQVTRVPAEIFQGFTEQMMATESGFSTGKDHSSLVRESGAPSFATSEEGGEQHLGGEFDKALEAETPLIVEDAPLLEGEEQEVEENAPAEPPAEPVEPETAPDPSSDGRVMVAQNTVIAP